MATLASMTSLASRSTSAAGLTVPFCVLELGHGVTPALTGDVYLRLICSTAACWSIADI